MAARVCDLAFPIEQIYPSPRESAIFGASRPARYDGEERYKANVIYKKPSCVVRGRPFTARGEMCPHPYTTMINHLRSGCPLRTILVPSNIPFLKGVGYDM